MYYISIIFITIFLVSCGATEKKAEEVEKIGTIASIEEASGICYVDKSDTLFVVGDNGFVYEIDRNGKELNSKDLSHMKDHDFEGIAYDDQTDQLYIVIEGVDNLLVLDRTLRYINDINIDRKDSDDRDIFEKEGEGLEGISIYNGEIYVSNQSFDLLPKSDPSVIVRLGLGADKASIEEVINPEYINISGMAFFDDILYLVSDTDNLLIKYDIKNREVISDRSIQEIDSSLKGVALEGVAFDKKGYIYFTIDDKKDGKIIKYKII
jgi:uncharacterized protein YjiK